MAVVRAAMTCAMPGYWKKEACQPLIDCAGEVDSHYFKVTSRISVQLHPLFLWLAVETVASDGQVSVSRVYPALMCDRNVLQGDGRSTTLAPVSRN